MPVKSISLLRQKLDALGNKPVAFIMHPGHKRTLIKKGTILKTYPDIFTVKVSSGEGGCVMAFSYADILTKAVEITLC